MISRQRKWRLRGRDIHDDDLIQVVAIAKVAEVGPHCGDGFTRTACRRQIRPIGECRDRIAAIEDRPRPDVFAPFAQMRLGARMTAGSKMLAPRASSLTLLRRSPRRMSWPPRTNWSGESRSTPSNSGRAVTRPVGAVRSLSQGGQSERHRRSDAAQGAHQPNPDTPIGHERLDSHPPMRPKFVAKSAERAD